MLKYHEEKNVLGLPSKEHFKIKILFYTLLKGTTYWGLRVDIISQLSSTLMVESSKFVYGLSHLKMVWITKKLQVMHQINKKWKPLQRNADGMFYLIFIFDCDILKI